MHSALNPDHCSSVAQINTIDPVEEGTSHAVLASYSGELAGGALSLAALPNNSLVSGSSNGSLAFFKVEGDVIRPSVIVAALTYVHAPPCEQCSNL